MRILLADNQPKVRFALRVLLERQAGYEIVGEIDTADELVPQIKASRPDLVLLGWELPGLTPDAAISVMHEIRPKLYVIALSGRLEARHAALAAGADDFVSKADPPERLLMAIGCCGQVG
jgi:DNA-binding NarL/FixJ family response regulator